MSDTLTEYDRQWHARELRRERMRDAVRDIGIIAFLIVAVIVGIASGAGIIAERQDAADNIAPRVELPECATEDSSNCAWNDGTGRSFIDVDGTVYYLP